MRIEDVLPGPVVRAYDEGRIAETSVAAWTEKYRAEPEVTAATLASLAPVGLPPREPLGAGEGRAPELTVAEATAQLTGRRPGPAATPPPVVRSEAPAPPMPTGAGFSDRDYQSATRALFPYGVGAAALEE